MAEITLQSKRLEIAEEALERLFYNRGWTDGLPIVPPTPERVARLLAATDRPADEVLGALPPKYGEASVEKIAVNAAMAGCDPQHLPVVIAAVEAMLEEPFNLYGCQATTHVVCPLVVVNGPVAEELDIACGYNCFGQGYRANALIGRAVRFVLNNIGGAVPGKLDRATFGTPAKYSYCVAENEAESPWEPLHVERGHDRAHSTVTVIGAEAPHNINDHGSYSALGLLKTIAETMCQPGQNNAYLIREGPWVVLSPEHAASIAADGFDKRKLREYLFEHSRIPLARFSRENVERYLISRFAPQLQAQAKAWLADPSIDVRVPIAASAEAIGVLVAGGAGKHSLYIPTFGTTRSITRRLELKNGTPVKSIKDFAAARG